MERGICLRCVQDLGEPLTYEEVVAARDGVRTGLHLHESIEHLRARLLWEEGLERLRVNADDI